jgi:FkbM family methyltransferase
MNIQDQHGNRVDTNALEKQEQDLAKQYIEENDVVLELGARYGSVSCIINSKLNCKTNQVVIEPDSRVWGALERNRSANKCQFHIVKGFVSAKKMSLTNINFYHGGYGATSVPDENSKIRSYSLEEISQGMKFNVLVADCEGFLETFFDENPNFIDNLRLVIFEADYPNKCNYQKIRNMLTQKNFKSLLDGHQNVWIKIPV